MSTEGTPPPADEETDAAPRTANEHAEAASANPFLPGAGAGPPPANPYSEQLAELTSQRDQLTDQLKRALAETENVRKRSERRIQEDRVYAVERFARDVLAISDQLGRALEALTDADRAGLPEAVANLLQGVELTQNELHATLGRHGVRSIEVAPGAEFNPAIHQAVSQIPSEHPAGTVAMLFQAGWMIGDRTLRAAMVAVSAGPPAGG